MTNRYYVMDEENNEYYMVEEELMNLRDAKKLARQLSKEQKTMMWIINYTTGNEVRVFSEGKEF